MRIDSSQADKLLRGKPLGFHLRTFASSLVEDGYTDRTIQLKLGLLACLGRWLQPTKLAITNLDETSGGISQAQASSSRGRLKNAPAVSRSSSKARRGSSPKADL